MPRKTTPQGAEIRNNPLRACAYIRVSHEKSAATATSLRSQHLEAMSYATSRNLAFVGSIVEAGPELPLWVPNDWDGDPSKFTHAAAASARAGRTRRGILKLLACVQSGEVDVVIFGKADRMARDLKDFIYIVDMIRKAGGFFVILNPLIESSDPIAGKIVMLVLGIVADMEGGMISIRNIEKANQLRKEGRHHGGILPIGARVVVDDKGRKMMDTSKRDATMSLVREMIEKDRTWQDIADAMNDLAKRGLGFYDTDDEEKRTFRRSKDRTQGRVRWRGGMARRWWESELVNEEKKASGQAKRREKAGMTTSGRPRQIKCEAPPTTAALDQAVADFKAVFFDDETGRLKDIPGFVLEGK